MIFFATGYQIHIQYRSINGWRISGKKSFVADTDFFNGFIKSPLLIAYLTLTKLLKHAKKGSKWKLQFED